MIIVVVVGFGMCFGVGVLKVFVGFDVYFVLWYVFDGVFVVVLV